MRAAPEVTPLLFWSLVASSCHAFTSKHGLSPFPFPSPAIGIIGAARRRRFRSSTILASTFLDRNRQCTQTQLQRENILSMRKQKASDRRTRRRQRGDIDLEEMPVGVLSAQTLTSNPMQSATWTAKSVLSSSLTTTLPVRNAASGYHSSMYSSSPRPATFATTASTSTTRGGGGGGRGRSLKRTTLYQSLQHYHASFLNPLTCEYQAEEDEVLGRIKASLDDPLGLEQAGYALYDMYTERRGNLFGQEVYRLVKATDATTTYATISTTDATAEPSGGLLLPSNHKFSNNDVIVLTEQPNGSGDFFTTASSPVSENSVCAEAVVLNIGPTYVDVSMAAGCFEATFGLPGNDMSGQGNKNLRLRADQFVSNVPYQRMVSALSQITAVPENKRSEPTNQASSATPSEAQGQSQKYAITMDDVIKEVILKTHVFFDPNSPLYGNSDFCNVEELSNKLAKPPMDSSQRLTAKVMKEMLSNPSIFREFNAPQRTAIAAALTRRITLIQGPPGTGKTCVAAAIGFGFVEQCKSISEHTKVLACAFSNVGADNLAEGLMQLGLNVIRVGKPSAVAESLWSYTLDAAIDRDTAAQKALQNAALATAQLSMLNRKRQSRGSKSSASQSERIIRDTATAAVKAAIQATNVAAANALRKADVIVATSVGSADPRLLAACGIVTESDEAKAASSAVGSTNGATKSSRNFWERVDAPDGLPPLSLPFVIIDEACQSVEPASLIPIVATNSCRSLVLLGDPCQLPPTVKSAQAEGLSVSLMERLAATLPHPNVVCAVDNTSKDSTFLAAQPIKQAISVVRSRSPNDKQRSYAQLFGGSILLSVQYRMHPSIAALPSAIFYDSLLTTPQFLAARRKFPDGLGSIMPNDNTNLGVRLISVGGRDNERQGTPSKFTRTLFSNTSTTSATSLLEQQTTYWNEAEAETITSLLKSVLSDHDISSIKSVGIISPYNGQVQLLKLMIACDVSIRDLLRKTRVSLEIKSVDGYQGRERDVIFFSAVRSNRKDRIGFLHDWRRMNVALTRAKSALLIVGDFDTLSSADRHWDALKKWASGVKCIVTTFDRRHNSDGVSKQ